MVYHGLGRRFLSVDLGGERTDVQVIVGDEEDLRDSPRSNVFLTAVLDIGTTSYPVRVRNLSIFGALLEGDALPSDGAKVLLKRGSLRAEGTIAWQSERHCGVRLDGLIRVDEWIRRAGPAGQQQIDSLIAQFRNGTPDPCRLTMLSPAGVQDTLDRIGAELLKICERIAGLSNMSVELAEEVLRIEAAAVSVQAAAKRAQ